MARQFRKHTRVLRSVPLKMEADVHTQRRHTFVIQHGEITHRTNTRGIQNVTILEGS